MHDSRMRAKKLAGIERPGRGRACTDLDLDWRLLTCCASGQLRARMENTRERLRLPEGRKR